MHIHVLKNRSALYLGLCYLIPTWFIIFYKKQSHFSRQTTNAMQRLYEELLQKSAEFALLSDNLLDGNYFLAVFFYR